ncbi:MAG: hemolysin III [Myxococcales bacterium]|nr:hemolysin III [Myxococcales bacterium]
MRGVSHAIGVFIALCAGVALVQAARTGAPATGAATYVTTLCVLLGVSALYHVPHWQPGSRAWLRRADHAAIFILIAGTYTPIALTLADAAAGRRLLWLAWLGAGMGAMKSLFWAHAPKPLTALLAVVLGWLVAGEWRSVVATLGTRGMALMLAGGAMYTTGALIYARKRPDPLPTVFGYHEIFHALVLGASVCHFWMVARVVG